MSAAESPEGPLSSSTIRSPVLLRRESLVPGGAVAMLAFILTLLAVLLSRERAATAHRLRTQARALELSAAVQRAFLVPMEVLHSVPALFDASDDVARQEFHTFVARAITRWPEMYAIEWFPRVLGHERASFEAAAGFPFKEVDAAGQLVPAKVRPEYLPLYYMEPPNALALGFDLASEAERIAPAHLARDRATPTLSPRIRLVEDPETVFSVAVFSPVYEGARLPEDIAERRRQFRGAAAIVFRVRPVMERMLAGYDLDGAGLVLLDLDAPRETTLLYESRPGLFDALANDTNGQAQRREFLLGNRHWEVRLRPRSADLGGAGLLLGGLALAVLLGLATAGAAAIRELRRRMKTAAQLGQYTLLEKIGEGGMGAVYRARHALLSRPTAIKLLSAEVDDERSRLFEREARLTSELTHPNTVVVYDYGRSREGHLYYVMEYLTGVTLDRLVAAEGAQPPARVVHFLIQVCGALAEAHGIGLIHRDIKPANLMLTRRGGIPDFIKVLDFGLVKRREGPGVALSGVHTLAGTPGYLAPESITAPENIDGRSDLYAVGAVAYYLLTGSPVFEGQNLVELCTRHLFDAPTPPSARSGLQIPASLDDIVLKCLAKAPQERYSSSSELAAALRACPGVEPWTPRDAEALWQQHDYARAAPGPAPSGDRRTIDVDSWRLRGSPASG